MALKQFEKELQDEKRKIEKYHATLKDKEARYQRMVAIASRKEDATKETFIINKEEEDFACLTDDEMKKRKPNKHLEDNEVEDKRLNDKVLDLTRRYETKNIEQKIQLENKELELNTVLSELRNQKEEIKGLKTKVDDLTKEGQILKDCGNSKTYVEKLEGTN